MKLLKAPLFVALVVSVAFHLFAAAMTLKTPPALEFEGSGETQHVALGQSPFNTVVAGTVDQTAVTEPVKAQPVQVQNVRARAEQNTAESVRSIETSPVKPILVTNPIQPLQTSSFQPSLALSSTLKNTLALPSKQQRPPEDTPRVAALEVTKAITVRQLPPVGPSRQAQPNKPINVKSASQPVTSRTNSAEADTLTQFPRPVTKATAATDVLQEVSNEVPPPPVKPPPPHEEKPKPTPAANSKSAAKKTTKPNPQLTRTSKNGAGGKSNQTAQEGGSQRRGKSEAAGNADVTNYPAKVYRKLLRSVRVPRGGGRARRDAVVRFTIQKSGSVTGIKLARSSGSKAFDQAVLKAVQKAAPFPPIPNGAGKRNWSFSLPVGL
jgi:periplasmic protein TonB